MKEVIVRLTGDYIKVKGGEYVRDIIRCKDCKYWDDTNKYDIYCSLLEGLCDISPNDFCSYGEVRDE